MAAGREIELGFRAFDAHELFCHLVAERLGCYGDEGVRVRLVDLTFREEDPLQVSCGSALLAALAGLPYRVVLVASARPMFWIVAARPAGIADLSGGRVATFPPGSPPWHLLRIALRGAGVDPEEIVAVPARDDAARLGLLRTGAVDAALVSSAAWPAEVERLGLATVSFLGDELAVPTTGLAAGEDVLREDPGALASLARAQRRALEAIHDRDPAANAVLGELGAPGLAEAVRRCLTRDGTIPAGAAEAAIGLVCEELGIAPPPVAAVYDVTALG